MSSWRCFKEKKGRFSICSGRCFDPTEKGILTIFPGRCVIKEKGRILTALDPFWLLALVFAGFRPPGFLPAERYLSHHSCHLFTRGLLLYKKLSAPLLTKPTAWVPLCNFYFLICTNFKIALGTILKVLMWIMINQDDNDDDDFSCFLMADYWELHQTGSSWAGQFSVTLDYPLGLDICALHIQWSLEYNWDICTVHIQCIFRMGYNWACPRFHCIQGF